MHKLVACFFLAVVAVASPSAALAAPITYDLIPVPLTEDFTLTGTVTTDGTIGNLVRGNFLSWSLHMQQTVAPFESHSATGDIPRPFAHTGLVTATQTSLSLPWATTNSNDMVGTTLVFGDLNRDPMSARFQAITFRGTWYTSVTGTFVPGEPHTEFIFYTTLPPSPFVFAVVVPEPSALVLAALGMASITTMGWRKRKARRSA
jgi:hypothetical protein